MNGSKLLFKTGVNKELQLTTLPELNETNCDWFLGTAIMLLLLLALALNFDYVCYKKPAAPLMPPPFVVMPFLLLGALF